MDGVNLSAKVSGIQGGLKTQKSNERRVNKLQSRVEDLNSQLKPLSLGVRFGYNAKVDFLYVQLIDTKTNRVIKQEPSSNFLKLKEVINSIIQDSLKEIGIDNNSNIKSINQGQKEVVNKINDTLKPINDSVEFKYINANELALVEKTTGEVVTKLDENQVEKLNQHMQDFIDFIGLSFDKKI